MVSRVSTDSPLGHLEPERVPFGDITNKPAQTGPGLSLAPAEEEKENEIPAEFEPLIDIAKMVQRGMTPVEDPRVHTLEHALTTREEERLEIHATIAQLHEKIGDYSDHSSPQQQVLMHQVLDLEDQLEKDAPELTELYQQYSGLAGEEQANIFRQKFANPEELAREARIDVRERFIFESEIQRQQLVFQKESLNDEIRIFEHRVIHIIHTKRELLRTLRGCCATKRVVLRFLIQETFEIKKLTCASRLFLSRWRERVLDLSRELKELDGSLAKEYGKLETLVGSERVALFRGQFVPKQGTLTKLTKNLLQTFNCINVLWNAKKFNIHESDSSVISRRIYITERDKKECSDKLQQWPSDDRCYALFWQMKGLQAALRTYYQDYSALEGPAEADALKAHLAKEFGGNS